MASLHHAGLIAKSLDARNKELRKKMGESEQYRLVAKQLEMEASHTNLLVQRLKSDKATLNSALIHVQVEILKSQLAIAKDFFFEVVKKNCFLGGTQARPLHEFIFTFSPRVSGVALKRQVKRTRAFAFI